MELKLNFIKPPESEINPKATIHLSGKLGFNKEAQKLLKLTEKAYIAFASNDADTNDDNLYAVVYHDVKEGAFKVSKAGEYYNVGTKLMFDNLSIDYRNSKVIYDIIRRGEYEGQEIFKLIKRVKKKKKKGEENI